MSASRWSIRRLHPDPGVDLGRGQEDDGPNSGPTRGCHGKHRARGGDGVGIVDDDVGVFVTEGEVERFDLPAAASVAAVTAATRAEPPSALRPFMPSRV